MRGRLWGCSGRWEWGGRLGVGFDDGRNGGGVVGRGGGDEWEEGGDGWVVLMF